AGLGGGVLKAVIGDDQSLAEAARGAEVRDLAGVVEGGEARQLQARQPRSCIRRDGVQKERRGQEPEQTPLGPEERPHGPPSSYTTATGVPAGSTFWTIASVCRRVVSRTKRASRSES